MGERSCSHVYLAKKQFDAGKISEGHEDLLRAMSFSVAAWQLRIFVDEAEWQHHDLRCPLPAAVLKAKERLPQSKGSDSYNPDIGNGPE